MKTFVYHIHLNVSNKEKSLPFYRELFDYFGYKMIIERDWGFGFSNGKTDFWVTSTRKKYLRNKFHRKNAGLNHIAFGVESRRNVDKFIKEFLIPRKIKPLYDSPREYSEYTKWYYAVYFEDPDRIKLEVTYIPGFKERTK